VSVRTAAQQEESADTGDERDRRGADGEQRGARALLRGGGGGGHGWALGRHVVDRLPEGSVLAHLTTPGSVGRRTGRRRGGGTRRRGGTGRGSGRRRRRGTGRGRSGPARDLRLGEPGVAIEQHIDLAGQGQGDVA